MNHSKNLNTVYVLHEYGARSHYNALVALGEQKGFKVNFHIFEPIALALSLYHLKFKIVISSILFLMSLPFKKKCKIVVGIAPFNSKLRILSLLLKRHQIYYHTSYTHWDGSMMAHPTKSQRLIKFWKNFVYSRFIHVFAVSKKTRDELIKNEFSKIKDITVVNHSFIIDINAVAHKKDNTFIYVGRLHDNKGISELLNIFKNRANATLTIVGDGPLKYLVMEYAGKYDNIIYKGYVNGLENLIPIYQENSYCITNSKKNSNWEELFGISIIEGMSSGCVPINTNHSGPSEIISNGENGFLVSENEIEKAIDDAILQTDEEYQKLRKNAIEKGKSYQSNIIASKWNAILIS